MKILAVDPGNHESGWVVYDTGKVLHSGVSSNDSLLNKLQVNAHAATVDVLAIEMMKARGMPVSNDEMETLVWIGRYQQAWPTPNEVILAYRADVKMHLCGSMTAKDANVAAALREIVGPKGTKKKPGPTFGVASHAWAALAVAVYVEAHAHETASATNVRPSLRRRARL